MDATARFTQLIKDSGAVLVRTGKHPVYRLPNRKTFVTANKSSDSRAVMNDYHELRRALGLKRDPKPKAEPKPERPKRKRQQRSRQQLLPMDPAPAGESFERKLLKAGYTEPPASPAPPAPQPLRQSKTREPQDKPKCFTYPPEVIKEAARIQQEQGTDAYNAYLHSRHGEVLEVHKVKIIHEEIPLQPTTMETNVERARKQVAQLQADSAAAATRIENDQKLMESNQTKIASLSQFISAYDLATEEANKIESLLGPAPAPQLATVTKAVVKFTSASLFDKARHLLSGKDGATFTEIYATVSAAFPGVTKPQVASAIQYDLAKQNGAALRRIGHGRATRYVLHQQAAAAAGAA